MNGLQLVLNEPLEARLDGAAESVATQEAVRVHTFGEVHAVRQQRHGHAPTNSNPFTRDLQSMRANMPRQATFALVMLTRFASACPAPTSAYRTQRMPEQREPEVTRDDEEMH